MDQDVMRPRKGDEDGITCWEARFATTATGAGDSLKVTIDGYDGGVQDFGPVVWTPNVGPAYPAAGDTALVALADTGRWWVLAWTAT